MTAEHKIKSPTPQEAQKWAELLKSGQLYGNDLVTIASRTGNDYFAEQALKLLIETHSNTHLGIEYFDQLIHGATWSELPQNRVGLAINLLVEKIKGLNLSEFRNKLIHDQLRRLLAPALVKCDDRDTIRQALPALDIDNRIFTDEHRIYDPLKELLEAENLLKVKVVLEYLHERIIREINEQGKRKESKAADSLVRVLSDISHRFSGTKGSFGFIPDEVKFVFINAPQSLRYFDPRKNDRQSTILGLLAGPGYEKTRLAFYVSELEEGRINIKHEVDRNLAIQMLSQITDSRLKSTLQTKIEAFEKSEKERMEKNKRGSEEYAQQKKLITDILKAE